MNYLSRKWDDFCAWLAWKLPTRLVWWCAVRIMAHTTTGIYKTFDYQPVRELTARVAADRWYLDSEL